MWFFPHFNTKPQIFKSSLFYGEARLWPTCEHVLVCLGPTITTGTRSQGWSMPLIYSVRHHHAGGHRRFSAGWSAGSLLAPGCLEKGDSAWTSSWDWLYSVCTLLTSHGTSVLLVNYRPWRTSKTSCRSNLFWVGGQRMVPCPWPEQHNHHFLSHRVSHWAAPAQAKDSNSAPVRMGRGTKSSHFKALEGSCLPCMSLSFQV